MADMMRDQRLNDRHEVLVMTDLESKSSVSEISTDQRDVLLGMLHDGKVRGVIACSILARLTSPVLMESFLTPLSSLAKAEPSNTILPWTLEQWRKTGGAELVRNLADSPGPLAGPAKESVRDANVFHP
jgi:hypothetical protein